MTQVVSSSYLEVTTLFVGFFSTFCFYLNDQEGGVQMTRKKKKNVFIMLPSQVTLALKLCNLAAFGKNKMSILSFRKRASFTDAMITWIEFM